MGVSVLPGLAIAPLQHIDFAGMTATAQKSTVSSVRGPGAVYVDTLVLGEAVPCRLTMVSPESPLRADQPSAAKKMWLALPSGTDVAAGETWTVTGETGDTEWTRVVLVEEVDLPRHEESRRRALVIDTASNP